ncbi:MAG TPA: amidase family protein, partial [Usitatibacteraceae bacterium]|nr:amidase family protein [Usitatibacteraceae bacterium]
DMSVAITEAAETLSAANCRVREVRLPAIYDEAQAQQRTVQLVENARHYALELSQYRAQLDPRLAAQLADGAAIPAEDYLGAITGLQSARKQTDFLFADCDAWLMPSAPGAAPAGLESTGDPVFNRLATAMHLPAINVPVLRNKNRMPLGLQLIGSRHQDEKLLAVAQRVMDLLRARHE